MTTRRRPKALKSAGSTFWREVHAAYELNEAEERLLVEACRTLDELDRLQEALTGVEPLVPGSMGQLRPNPLFDEVRKHRETLQRLVGSMAIPAEGEIEGRTAASLSARRAADVRWMGERRGPA